MKVSGMSCGHCVGAVTGALKKLDGVDVENVAVGSATVNFDSAVTSTAEISKAIKDVGFEVVA